MACCCEKSGLSCGANVVSLCPRMNHMKRTATSLCKDEMQISHSASSSITYAGNILEVITHH